MFCVQEVTACVGVRVELTSGSITHVEALVQPDDFLHAQPLLEVLLDFWLAAARVAVLVQQTLLRRQERPAGHSKAFAITGVDTNSGAKSESVRQAVVA